MLSDFIGFNKVFILYLGTFNTVLLPLATITPYIFDALHTAGYFMLKFNTA
jgi:hypothetical protein